MAEGGRKSSGLGDRRQWQSQRAPSFLFIAWCLICLISQIQGSSSSYAPEPKTIGINYGTVADNLLPPAQAVQLITSMKIGRVKIFDTQPAVLNALANTGIEVVLGLPNDAISAVALHAAAGDQWVVQNLVPYYPATKIVTILVGNELFSDPSLQSSWVQLLPAIQNIQLALVTRGWTNAIKISTAVALDVLATSYPPSTGSFRADIAVPVLQPLLNFLSSTSSYLFVNAYPFFAYSADPGQISLSYATFGSPTLTVLDSGFTYTNLLDAQLDAVNAAIAKLGFANNVRVAIGETGWPTLGDPDQVGATIQNAENYNQRLVNKILSTVSVGSPARPGIFIPTFIFSLFNEDLKPGPTTERNWGLLYPNGTQVYPIDLTGTLAVSHFTPTGNGSNSPPTVVVPPPIPVGNPSAPSTPPPSPPSPVAATGSTWCVAESAAKKSALMTALNYACGSGGADCVPIQPGQVCFQPNTLVSHASWAFNSYWQTYKGGGGSCSFGGTAILTAVDPSYGSCTFPAS
ncbi:hypothetical protein BDL97_15G074600 [Sphagnum fallax]|nr:hypothetical protein BDL97_15G074600 [Sphagnum fallax]